MGPVLSSVLSHPLAMQTGGHRCGRGTNNLETPFMQEWSRGQKQPQPPFALLRKGKNPFPSNSPAASAGSSGATSASGTSSACGRRAWSRCVLPRSCLCPRAGDAWSGGAQPSALSSLVCSSRPTCSCSAARSPAACATWRPLTSMGEERSRGLLLPWGKRDGDMEPTAPVLGTPQRWRGEVRHTASSVATIGCGHAWSPSCSSLASLM